MAFQPSDWLYSSQHGIFFIKRVYQLNVCRVASCSTLLEILIIVCYGCYGNRDRR